MLVLTSSLCSGHSHALASPITRHSVAHRAHPDLNIAHITGGLVRLDRANRIPYTRLPHTAGRPGDGGGSAPRSACTPTCPGTPRTGARPRPAWRDGPHPRGRTGRGADRRRRRGPSIAGRGRGGDACRARPGSSRRAPVVARETARRGRRRPRRADVAAAVVLGRRRVGRRSEAGPRRLPSPGPHHDRATPAGVGLTPENDSETGGPTVTYPVRSQGRAMPKSSMTYLGEPDEQSDET